MAASGSNFKKQDHKMALKKEEPKRYTDIPSAVLHHGLSNLLDAKSMNTLFCLNRSSSNEWKITLALKKLCYHVVRGEEEQAKAMLEKNPELLRGETLVIDYPKRKIRGTPFRIALAADDVEMCQMMLPFFDKLKDGLTLKESQYRGQLPEESQTEEKMRQAKQDEKKKEEKKEEKKEKTKEEIEALCPANFLHVLNRVVDAIDRSAATTREELEKDPAIVEELKQYRNYLEPKDILITSGKYFNPAILIKALQLCKEKAIDMRGDYDTGPKNTFILQNLVGYIERIVPANYGQRIAQKTRSWERPLRRSFEFQFYDNRIPNKRYGWRDNPPEVTYFYFPLDSNPEVRLGYDFALVSEIRGAAYSHAGFIGSIDDLIAILSGKLNSHVEIYAMIKSGGSGLQESKSPCIR